MIDVSKIVPKELDPNKEYIVRVRSINPLGTPSTWSEGLYIDTSRVSSEAGLFTQSNSEFSILNDEGEIVFGAFTTKRQRSNLIANPSFELDLVGWSALANAAITRLSVQSFYGLNSASVKPLIPITSNENIGIKLAPSDYVSVSENEYYTVSLYVYREYNIGEHAGLNEEHSFVELTADLYDGSNNLKTRIKPSQSTRIPNNKWTRVYVENVRIPSGVSKIGLTLKIDNTVEQTLFSTTERMFVDGVLLEEASKLDSYFDGSTVAGSTSWSSVAHASASLFDNATASTVFINGALNVGGILESTNFVDQAGVYSLTGTQIDLSQGTFTSPNFSIDAAGDVYIASGVNVEGYIQVGGAAADINGGLTTIDGGKITANSIEGSQISATTSIQVGDDNVGAYPYIIIEGGATPTQTFIKTSDSSYGTGNGFYMDASGRFSLGTALTFDDGVLTIGGNAGGLDYIPIGGAAADINANVTTISGSKISTGTLYADRIVAGSIEADRIAIGGLNDSAIFGLGVITADKLAADATKSVNYDPPDNPEIFADLGAFFDLSTGNFTSKAIVMNNITGDVWINSLNLEGVSIGDTLRLAMNEEATLASLNHPFQIGADGTLNLVMDNNEIQARNNGFAAVLALNEQGGQVTIGSGGLSSGGPLDGYNSKLTSTVALNLGTTTHALTLGNIAGINMALDGNTIQAIDNSTATPVGATLTLNEYGGNVNIGGEVFLQNSIGILNNYQFKFPGNSRIRYFDQTNESALATLLGGTTLGLLIDGPHYGHVAIGLRANDDTDLFAITTPGIVSDPSTALNNIVFSVNRRGDVALDRDISVGRNLAVTSSATVGTNLTVTGTLSAGDISFTGPVFNLGGPDQPVADDNKDRGIQFRWHTGAAAKVGFFGFDDSTQKFIFIPDSTVASGQYSGTKGEIDAYIDASNILNLSTNLDATYVNVTGDTMTGPLITITPTAGGHAVNKTYADGLITTHVGLADPHTQYVLAAGDTMTGDLLMSGNDIQLSAGILALNGLANDERVYVDTAPADDITIIRAGKDGALRTNFTTANANILTWNYTTGVRVYKDLLVDGNLTISGTTTTINTDVILLEDPIIGLGGGVPLTINDGKDRGIEFRYYDTTSKLGFMGWDNSTGKFALLLNTTNVNEVISGTKAEIDAYIDFSNILNYTSTLDTRYVNVTGDAMTGALSISTATIPALTLTGTAPATWTKVFRVEVPSLGNNQAAQFTVGQSDTSGRTVELAYQYRTAVTDSFGSIGLSGAPSLITFSYIAASSGVVRIPSGHLELSQTPTAINHAVRKDYADGLITTHLADPDPHPQYLTPAEGDALFLTPAEGDAAYVNVTGDSMSGTLNLNNGANLAFVDSAGTYPTTAGGFIWTLNNDGASIKAVQPSSDSIDFVFKLNDNTTANDRFVFWVDDYTGAAADKYPIVALGTGDVYFGLSSTGADQPDLATYGLLVGQGTNISYHRGIFRVDSAPVNTTDVVRKLELDTKVAKAGDTMTGRLIFDGATGARLGTTNKWEIYLGTDGPQTYNRSVTSTNQVLTLWNSGGTRWIYAPAPAGTPDYTKEFAYDFGTSRWAFETPVTVGVGTALTDAVQKTYVDTEILTVSGGITNHLNDTTDAHDASAISYANTFIAPTSDWLNATNLQIAINQIGAQIEAPDPSTIEAILAALNTIGTPTNPIDNSNIFETGVIVADAIAAGAILASKIAANVINASHIEANSFTGNEFNAESVIRVGTDGEIILQGTSNPLTTMIEARGTNPVAAYDEWIAIQRPTNVLPLDYNLNERSGALPTAVKIYGPAIYNVDLDYSLSYPYVSTASTNRSFRIDAQRLASATGVRYGQGGPLFIELNSSGQARGAFWTDNGDPATPGSIYRYHSYSSILEHTSDGTATGRVQLRIEWNDTTSTGSLYARNPDLGYPIDSDLDWTFITSNTWPSEHSNAGTSTYYLSQPTLAAGAIYYGVYLDIGNPSYTTVVLPENIPSDRAATSLTCSRGKTWTIYKQSDNNNAPVNQIIPKGTFSWISNNPLGIHIDWTDTMFADIRIPNIPFARKGLAQRFLADIGTSLDIDNSTVSLTFVLYIPETYNGIGPCGLYSDGGPSNGGGIILDGYTVRGLRSTAGAVTSAIEYTLPGPGTYTIGYLCSPGIGGDHKLFVNGREAASLKHTVAPTFTATSPRLGNYYGRVGANGSTTLSDSFINNGSSGLVIAEFVLDNLVQPNAWFEEYYRNLFEGFGTGDGFHIDASGRFSAGTSLSWDGRRYLTVGDGLQWDDETGTLTIGSSNSTSSPLKSFKGVWESRLGSNTIIPNIGVSGTALNATTTGLIQVKGPAIWTGNSTNNKITGPAPTSLAGDIELISRLSVSTWASAPDSIIMAAAYGSGSFWWILPGGGTLYVGWRIGSATYATSVAHSLSTNKTYWLKVTRSASTGSVNYYYAPDAEIEPTSWTQIGGSQSTPVGNLDAPGAFVMNSVGPAKWMTTKRAIIRASGSTVIDTGGADIPADSSATSYICNSGQTLTISRTATGVSTTIVPGGKTFYINPDQTNAANKVAIPDNAAFDVSNTWGYFNFPGKDYNWLTTSHVAAYSITGDIDIIVYVQRPPDEAAHRRWIYKDNLGGGQGNYNITWFNGAAYFSADVAGVTKVNDSSVSFAGWAAETWSWIRMTRVAATGVYSWYRVADQENVPTSWGTAQTTNGSIGALDGGAGILYIGGSKYLGPYNRGIGRVVIKNGIGGTTAFDTGGADIPTNVNATSYTCTSGQVVTIVRPASIVDGFNRANSTTTMGSTNTGQTWTPQAGVWGISSNEAYLVSGNQATTVVESGLSDCWITVAPISLGDAGLCWRSIDNLNHFVLGYGGGNLQAYKNVAGSYTSVGAAAYTFIPGDIIGVRLVGSLHTITVNGVDKFSFTESTHQGGTKHGLRVYSGSTTHFNNFFIEPVGATISIVPRVAEDAVMVWAGQIGNTVNNYPRPMRIGIDSDNQLGLVLATTNSTPYVEVYTTGADISAGGSGGTSTSKTIVSVLFGVLDRAKGLLKFRSYGPSGLLYSAETTASNVGSINASTGMDGMSTLPGSVLAFGWNKGIGVALSDDQMAEIADHFLNSSALSSNSAIESKDFYLAPGATFSSTGTKINLTTGAINSPQLAISDTTGEASFSGNLVAPSGNIGGWTIGTTTIVGGSTTLSSAGSVYQGVGNYSNTDTKWYLGSNGYFSLADKLTWDGATLTVVGNITGGVIDIGGADTSSFHVNATGDMWLGAALIENAPFKVSSSGALDVGGGDGSSFHVSVDGDMWLGAATFALAPFRVSNLGALDVGGVDGSSFHVSVDGNMWFGAADYASAPFKVSNLGALHVGGEDTSSFHVDVDGNMWLGAGTYAAATKFKVSSGGDLVATNANINGTIVASLGSIGSISIVNNLTGGQAATGIKIGTGVFGNANTPLYIDSAGDFSLKDKLVWDQSAGTLTITGSGAFSGSITASSGTIGALNIGSSLTNGGATTGIYVGGGNGIFNNTGTAFYADSAGWFSLKDQLSWNGTTLTIAGTAVISGAAITNGTIAASKLILGRELGALVRVYHYSAFTMPATKEALDAMFTGVNVPVNTYGVNRIHYLDVPGWTNNNLGPAGRADNYGTEWFADLYIDTAGTWQFVSSGDDANDLKIDNVIVASHYGGHAAPAPTQGGLGYAAVTLTAGWHRITVRHVEATGQGQYSLYYRSPAMITAAAAFEIVPQSMLRRGDLSSPAGSGVVSIENGAISAEHIVSQSITADKVATDAIVSKTYTYTSGEYSDSGTFFNLAGVGYIRSKNFAINSSGNAFFRGHVEAASGSFTGTITANTGGSIAGWTIAPTTLTAPSSNIVLTADANAKMVIGATTNQQIQLLTSGGPKLSIGQSTVGYNLAGIYFDVNGGTPRFSLGVDDFKWDGTTLSIGPNFNYTAATNTLAIHGGTLVAGTVTTSKLAVLPTAVNMVPNGDFSDPDFLATWGFGGPSTASRVADATSPVGNGVVASTAPFGGIGGPLYLLNAIPVEPGKQYTYSCWIRHDLAGAIDGTHYIRLSHRDSTNTYVGYNDFVGGEANAVIASWTKREFSWTCPAGVNLVSPEFYNYDFSTGNLYVTGITLIPKVGTIVLEDGAITGDKINATTSIQVGTGTNKITINGAAGSDANTYIRSGTTAFESGTGFYVNAEGKLYLGNILTGKYLSWDGTDLEVTQIKAGTGTIGGWMINGDHIITNDGDIKLDNANSRIEVGDVANNQIWISGGTTAANSAIHTENITDFNVGTGSGFWLDGSGRLSLGNHTSGDKLTYNGSTLDIIGNITADAGNIGGWGLLNNTLTSTNNHVILSAIANSLTIGSVASNKVTLTGTGTASTTGIGTGNTTGYGNGTGAWIGGDGKVSFGGTDLTWDGATLTISGDADIHGDALVNGTLTINKLAFPAPQGSNLIANYSFADGITDGWALVEGGPAGHSVIVDATSPANNDDYVLSVGAASRAVGTRAVPLIPGKTYHISAWIKAASSAGIYYIRMNWKTAYPAGDYVTSGIRDGISPGMDEGVSNSTITSWTKREFTWTAPAGAYWGSLSFYSWTGTTGLYVDEVTITEQAVTTSIQNGAITTEKLLANSLQSIVYNGTSTGYGNLFATDGMLINLGDATIKSENFAIASNGTAAIRGTVIAETGYIGNTTQGWSITGSTINSVGVNAIVLDANNNKITIGTGSNRIGMEWSTTPASNKFYIGNGDFNSLLTSFYGDGSGRLSIGNLLKFEAGALTVTNGGFVGGYIQSNNYSNVWANNSNGSITAGSFTFTVASGQFVSAMLGATITINGAGTAGAPLVTTIAGYTSSTIITLTAAAVTTVSNAIWVINPRNNWSYTGSYFNLSNGDISTPGLSVNASTGALYVRGSIDATSFNITDSSGINRAVFTAGGTTTAPDGSSIPDPSSGNYLRFAGPSMVNNPATNPNDYSYLEWNNKVGYSRLTAGSIDYRWNQLFLNREGGGIHSKDYAAGLGRSYVSMQPTIGDMRVLAANLTQSVVYVAPNYVSIEADTPGGAPGNRGGNIYLRGGTTYATGAVDVAGRFDAKAAAKFWGTTDMWVTNFGSTSTFNGVATFNDPVNVNSAINVSNTINNNYIQFSSVTGPKLNLYGTAYKLGIADSTLYYDSSVYHKFYSGGSERFAVHGSGATAYSNLTASGGSVTASTHLSAGTEVYARAGMRMGQWSANGQHGAVEGYYGYLLLGAGGVDGSCYLRGSNSGWSLNIGQANGYIRFENWINIAGMTSGYLGIDGNGYVVGGWSRREFKENIVPLPLDTGDIIDRLEPVQFIYKNLHPEFGELSPEADEWRRNDVKYGFIVDDVVKINEKFAFYDIPKRDVLDADGNPVIDTRDPDPTRHKPFQEPTGELIPTDWDHKPLIAVMVKELQDLRRRVAELEGV